MTGDAYSRFFTKQELVFRAVRDKSVPLKFHEASDYMDVYATLKAAVDGKQAFLNIKQDDDIELKKIVLRESEGVAVLLFHRDDPGGLTQMYKHRTTREVRASNRTDDESISTSAHMIVSLHERANTPDTYDAVLEEAAGITKTLVMRLFDAIFSRYPYTFEDDKGDEGKAVCRVKIRGHASESIQDAMEDSVVRNVFLIKPGTIDGFDPEHVEVKDDVRRIKLTATRNETIPALRRLWAAAQTQNWTQCRVQVDMPEQKKSRIVSLERNVEAAEALFVRAVPVSVTSKIPACCEALHEELVQQGILVFRGEVE